MSGTTLSLFTSDNFLLVPGMKLTMAFVIGQYAGSERCARIGCSSRTFSITTASIRSWYVGQNIACRPKCYLTVLFSVSCGLWMRKSTLSLPKPMKPLVKRSLLSAVSQEPWAPTNELESTSNIFNDDRRYFKNVSIYITELPQTPDILRARYIRYSSFRRVEDTRANSTEERWFRSLCRTSKTKLTRLLLGRRIKSKEEPGRSPSWTMRDVTRAVISFRSATGPSSYTPSRLKSSLLNLTTRSSEVSEEPHFQERYPVDGLPWDDLSTWLSHLFPGLIFNDYKVFAKHLVVMSRDHLC